MSDPEIMRKETPNVGHGSSYCGNTEVEAKFPDVLCLFAQIFLRDLYLIPVVFL